MTQRLTAQDAAFLHIEDSDAVMHIGSVAIFEGPPPPQSEVRAMIAGKLPLVPRYRQKVRFVPLRVSRPVWVGDPHFVLDYHLRRTALPAPGGADELRSLVSRLMAQQLDRRKPLWEMWVVEGLDDDRWAIVSKVHHCLADGIAGSDLLTLVLDKDRQGGPPVHDEWRAGPDPSGLDLLAGAVADRLFDPVEQVRSARQAVTAPRELIWKAAATAKGLVALSSLVRPKETSSLNGPIGPHRRWDWAVATLDEVKVVRKSLGGTVNDVVLASVTAGFRRLLEERGEPTANRSLRSLVPVSIRQPGDESSSNRVSAMFAELPVGIADPVERLHAISGQMRGLKESAQAVAADTLVAMTGFAPPLLLALGTRAAFEFPQRYLNTVTTNVPGPQYPLFALGRQLVQTFPYVPIASTVRIAVAIYSYDGSLHFGVTGDYETAADIGVLTQGIEHEMALLQAAAGTDRTKAKGRTRR